MIYLRELELPKTDLVTNFLNPADQSFENVSRVTFKWLYDTGLKTTVGQRKMSDQNQKLSEQTKNTPDILSDGKNSRQK